MGKRTVVTHICDICKKEDTDHEFRTGSVHGGVCVLKLGGNRTYKERDGCWGGLSVSMTKDVCWECSDALQEFIETREKEAMHVHE